MAKLGQFGNLSPVALRALVRLKQLEAENKELRENIIAYERLDEIKGEYEGNKSPPVDLRDLDQQF
jgi:hypothetical protein